MGMVRGPQKARNKWVLNAHPFDPEDPAKRLPETCTAVIQVIPDAAFNEYGERKIAGVTLEELKRVYETAEPLVINQEAVSGRVSVRIVVGGEPGRGEWSRAMLKEIIDTIEREGVLTTKSPMAVDEQENEVLRKLIAGEDQGMKKEELVDLGIRLKAGSRSALTRMNKAEIKDAIESAAGAHAAAG